VEQGEAGSKRRLDGASSFHAQLALLLQQDLQARLRDVIGLDSFSRGTGYLTDWQAGLAAGLDSDAPGLHRGGLRRSLQRPGSCMALAVNSFLPWVPHPRKLALCGLGEFTEIQFDGRCPTGVRGTPPHIEVLASGPMGVVGVTARVFDYLVKRRSRPSPAYGSLELPARMAPWGELLREAGSDEPVFHHVDTLTLAKLAVGLGRIFAHRTVRLLYLFVEPAQAPAVGPFAAHRAELARLIDGTRDSGVPLTAISFQELWQAWRDGQTPDAVRAVAAELCRRYAVAMPRATSL
jgi:hypothetical protein